MNEVKCILVEFFERRADNIIIGTAHVDMVYCCFEFIVDDKDRVIVFVNSKAGAQGLMPCYQIVKCCLESLSIQVATQSQYKRNVVDSIAWL